MSFNSSAFFVSYNWKSCSWPIAQLGRAKIDAKKMERAIVNSLKINISMCLIGTIQGEFLTSKSGIGYLIMYGTQVFNLNLVMTGIILLTVISYINVRI